MRSSFIRAAFAALIGVFAIGLSQTARADSGTIRLTIIKAGWVIGGSGGSGTLNFRGRTYPLSIGGISYGFTFGASQTVLTGYVRNINRPSDVAGVYGAGGAGAAVGAGVSAIVLANPNGAVLELSGRQTGLIVSADLSGLAISMR